MLRPELLDMSNAALRVLLEQGHPIDPAGLDDFEYRGISLGLPHAIEKLTWKTFKKVFYRDPATGLLRGWNVRIKQAGVDGPWEPMMKAGKPLTFGHYEVVDATEDNVPRGCARGLLIDYGRGKNKRFDPVRRLRDPIVALERGSTEVLLGWSFVDAGLGFVSTPSFFCLERDVPVSHVPDA